MKNEYSFNHLIKQEIASREKEADVFYDMLNIIKTGVIIRSVDKPEELYEMLKHDKYYIAHNLVLRKGKSEIFKGRVFISNKEDLIDFLHGAYIRKDLRPFLISPIFSEKPQKVVYIDEEQVHLYSR